VISRLPNVYLRGAHSQRNRGWNTAFPEPSDEWRLVTVLSDGRLHHSLDAVAAQAAVVADAFDFQQAPIDLPANLL
jgi:hypothetical protein